MKLFRHGPLGYEKPGAIDDQGNAYDVSDFTDDYDVAFIANGGIDGLKEYLANTPNIPKILKINRYGMPFTGAQKLICVGLNYAKHAEEMKVPQPEEPLIFSKAISALSGPEDGIVLPPGSKHLDWEVELAVVIGKRAMYLSQDMDVQPYIAGYMLHNDVSERNLQLERGGQWIKGKSNDSFAPIGPFLVTTDEIINPQSLDIWLKVNGEIKQQSNTADQIFDVQKIITYLSHFMSLNPGDIISTGTPEGVGNGMIPPQFLKVGDTIELGINGLGTATQRVISFQG